MPEIVELPHVGESVVEGTIGKWLKQPGDKVERYEPLVEVVTDKVTMEVPSPVSGSLSKILAEEGETVPMGAPLAEIETSESARPNIQESLPQDTISTTGFLISDGKPVGPTGGGGSDDEAAAATGAEGPPRVSPAVRRLAHENNVDISRLFGTGVNGRITRQDVLEHIALIEGNDSLNSHISSTNSPVNPNNDGRDNAPDEHKQLTPVRKQIAEAMVRSVNQIPHAWSIVEVDVSGLVTRRSELRAEFDKQNGVELTYLPFFMKVVAESLRENPTLNASWGGDKIIIKRRINLGIAVAGPTGLVVPVVHDADRLSISGLALALNDLIQRTRQNKLRIEDVQDGTFTLNNTGALGSIASQPIINYPQAAILTTEVIQKRPVVINDGIAVRSMVNLCMSFDHRINDGAEASAFLRSVKDRLERIGSDTGIN
ncbi:MAG: branched-chain alpha-keto acid dehydrogenase subunit E2 [Chloroflexi bacterium]|nr:branched-chain alpha-keto acid dehydrogenase subunit E2 [Chloroflexota bacterium]